MAMGQGTTDQSLDSLLERAQAGDQAAWEELFRQCYPKVVRVVRRKLTSSAMRSLYDSTDFASDAWKSLVARSGGFDFPTIDHLMAYLVKVARNKVIDEDRRLHTLKNEVGRARPIEFGGEDRPARELASNEPTASQLAVTRETLDELRSGLGEPERMIIDLKLQGDSNEAIAAQVGWHVRKVQRFLQDLRETQMRPEMDELRPISRPGGARPRSI